MPSPFISSFIFCAKTNLFCSWWSFNGCVNSILYGLNFKLDSMRWMVFFGKPIRLAAVLCYIGRLPVINLVSFQNFLLFLLCSSWFSWLQCYRIRSPCVGIFHINLKSYQTSIIHFLVGILFHYILRKKKAELLFLKKEINSTFYRTY